MTKYDYAFDESGHVYTVIKEEKIKEEKTGADLGKLGLVIENYLVTWDQGTLFSITDIGGHGSSHVQTVRADEKLIHYLADDCLTASKMQAALLQVWEDWNYGV